MPSAKAGPRTGFLLFRGATSGPSLRSGGGLDRIRSFLLQYRQSRARSLGVERSKMTTAHDVAAYILSKTGEITAMKLQKLVYYSQAWSLVWDEEPLFDERIEAWVNGPVVPDLYRRHRGMFKVSAWPGADPGSLTDSQRQTIDAVLGYY